MRFSIRRATRWTPFLIFFLLITESCADHNTLAHHSKNLYHPLSSFPYAFDFYPHSTSPLQPSGRFKRQPDPPEFTWKPTKTPKFVTSKVEKHPEPVLRVYPPDALYRSGRSRELQQQPQSRGNTGRRVIYYATLPDIPRVPTNVAPLDNRFVHYPMPMLLANQQRSYNPSKGGKEFVTKVSSSIIGIRPNGEKNDFKIFDAQTTPFSGGYMGASPYNRVHVDYNMIGNVGERPNFNYYPSYYTPTHPKNQYELISPQYIKAQYPVSAHYAPTPYYGNIDKSQYHQLAPYQQYQHQSSPYLYGNDVSKLPAPYHNPPYPSRHTRFPTDRYPIPSPLSQYNLAPPPAAPGPAPTAPPNLTPSHQDFNDQNLNSFQQPNLGIDSPSPTLSSHPSGFDGFNGNLDHDIIDVDEPSIPGGGGLSLKDKIIPNLYNSLGNKYFDLNTFSQIPPFKNTFKEPLKFDKGTMNQISDWLINNTSPDTTGLEIEDVSPNREHQVKASGHTAFLDSQMVNQNVTQTIKDSTNNGNTVITPFTNSNGTSNGPEERTDR